MLPRALSALGVALVFAAGCGDSATIPHTPTHFLIVSGTNQSGDVGAALAQPLVVQVVDGAGKPVSGVPVAWTVTGGGSVSPATGTTDANGKTTAIWTLASSIGTQVATATSSQITGVSVSFVANNGSTITGSVTSAPGLPFGASFSRVAAGARLAATKTTTRRPSSNRIIVGFRDNILGVAAAGSNAYRSMSTARATLSVMRTNAAALTKAHAIGRAELSPSMLAARFKVSDTTQIEATMAALRNEANVAWVERDEIISIRDGAPKPMAASVMKRVAQSAIPPFASTASVATNLPNDPDYFLQLWPSAMLDLPRAWAITTGSTQVIVASVDMGIRFDHPDIAANLTNDGYDFVTADTAYDAPQGLCDGGTFITINGDGDGPDPDPTDPNDIEFDSTNNCWAENDLGDHGLWTAGIIGAVSNEGKGVAGVNWNVRIRPVRVLGITGDGSNFDIAQGILYAAGLPAPGAGGALVQPSTPAQIINLSLGGPQASSTLRNAVNAAFNAGSLVVASAGNDGLDIPEYPAGFTNAMAVSAVGMDGALATYSNGGTFISVAAPGGDFRFDDNGGGGVLGPGWDFTTGTPTYLFGYGTSAAAPYVSGVAALLLAQTPGLTPTQLRSRIEQFATRPSGVTRSDTYGWGIVNAYNSLTQQSGPTKQTYARLLDATTGLTVKSVQVNSAGTFAFTQLTNGAYYVQVGDDEAGDGILGTPGRRFAWAGGQGAPTVFNVNGNAQTTAIALGIPTEVEPNDDAAHANVMSVGTYVTGNITTPDARDMYSVTIATAGTYTFETSGLVGSCGEGIELDTVLQITSSAGAVIGTNDNFTSSTSRFCSRVRAMLTPGVYYATVTGTGASSQASHGRYRLEIRSGN
ncbi:MAG: S8 family serine peptidase [Gemmatimonadaceae bacterium]